MSNKEPIIKITDKIISKDVYTKIYNEVMFEVLNDIFRKKFVELLLKDKFEVESIKQIIKDNLK